MNDSTTPRQRSNVQAVGRAGKAAFVQNAANGFSLPTISNLDIF